MLLLAASLIFLSLAQSSPLICSSSGDPHITSFAGVFFDCQSSPWQNLLTTLDGLVVLTHNAPWSAAPASPVRVNDQVLITAPCGTVILATSNGKLTYGGATVNFPAPGTNVALTRINILAITSTSFQITFEGSGIVVVLTWYNELYSVFITAPNSGAVEGAFGVCMTGECGSEKGLALGPWTGAITEAQAKLACALVKRGVNNARDEYLFASCLLDVQVSGNLKAAAVLIDTAHTLELLDNGKVGPTPSDPVPGKDTGTLQCSLVGDPHIINFDQVLYDCHLQSAPWQTGFSHAQTGLTLKVWHEQWIATGLNPIAVIGEFSISALGSSTIFSVDDSLLIDGKLVPLSSFTATETLYTNFGITSLSPNYLIFRHVQTNVIIEGTQWISTDDAGRTQTAWNMVVRAPSGLLGTGGLCRQSTCGTPSPPVTWTGRDVSLEQATAACRPAGDGVFFQACLLDVNLGDDVKYAQPIINCFNACARYKANCLPNPCKNGGVCHSNAAGDGPACVCPPPFSGATCGDNEGSGGPTPSLCPTNANCATSGGTCVTDALANVGYSCSFPQCAAGFVGSACQWPTPCTPGLCQNGGHCSLVQGAAGGVNAICTCKSGWTGATCATASRR